MMGDEDILLHYDRADEASRLFEGPGRLERARVQELLSRTLPPPPATIVDVGGGPGTHALWLAQLGYSVHLSDPVERHVEKARTASAQQPDHPIESIDQGDARALNEPDNTADAALLFGPLYHLTERTDRIAALRESWRVLKPGGLAFLVGVSRFASALDGLFTGHLEDEQFAQIVEADLATGQHRNPTGHYAYFTRAYFHRPEDLRTEAEDAGFKWQATLAVDGPGWLLHDFDNQWEEPTRRTRLLDLLRRLEAEPALLGVSAHIMVIARKHSPT